MPIVLLFLRLIFPELLDGPSAAQAPEPDVGWLATTAAKTKASFEEIRQADRARKCAAAGLRCGQSVEVPGVGIWDYTKGPPPVGGGFTIRVTPYNLSYQGRIVKPGDPDYAEVMEVFEAVHERGEGRPN